MVQNKNRKFFALSEDFLLKNTNMFQQSQDQAYLDTPAVILTVKLWLEKSHYGKSGGLL